MNYWMSFLFDKEKTEELNKYVERYVKYTQTTIEKALENYYTIAFNSIGYLTNTPFSFDAFKDFIEKNNLLNFNNDDKKNKKTKN